MWNDDTVVIKNLYGMALPSPKHMKDRMKRVSEVIEKLGDKYCLAIPVKKLRGAKRGRL